MESVYFCCPVCQTRYQSSASEIKSSKPYFKCRACSTVFSFEFPFQDNPKYEIIETKQERTKACTQCGALNFPKEKECYSCGVIFDKLKVSTLETDSPYVSKKWSEVLSDFENPKKHQAFISDCVKLQKIDFAIECYKNLKSAQGGEDSLCDLRILELQALKGVDIIKKNPKSVVQTVVLTCAVLLIIIGVIKPYYRNFVGFGVLLCVFLFGIESVRKGKWG